MFSRLIAFFILISIIYILFVFLSPSLADQIGYPAWNHEIRNFKSNLEKTEISLSGVQSLYERSRDIAKPYIEESRNTLHEIQNTAKEIQSAIEIKTQQLETAIESTKKAIEGVKKAKQDISETLGFSSGSNY